MLPRMAKNRTTERRCSSNSFHFCFVQGNNELPHGHLVTLLEFELGFEKITNSFYLLSNLDVAEGPY